MTTIASDGETIASDSQITGSFKFESSYKKLHYIRGAWVGFCGDIPTIEKVREWMEAGAPPQMRPQFSSQEDWTALELTPDGELFLWEGDGRRFPAPVPFAIGSGGDFAMGAMLMGAAPSDAVAISSKLDLGTGGRIHVGTAGVAPGAKKKRAVAKTKRARSK